jgi:RNA polymerase sigma-70 factor (ECF subfamily)
MAKESNAEDAARRFRDAALPHLDAVYTLARYLVGNAADAEDAVQECYLRALKYFDTFKGPAIRPWLFSILRNVCHAEFARRSVVELRASEEECCEEDETPPLWRDVQESPETTALRQRDAEAIQELVAALPAPFREAIVLREVNDLSYRAIADVVGAPIGTVMSRIARARSLLRDAWQKKEGG